MKRGMPSRLIRGLLVYAAITATVPVPTAIAAEPGREPTTWKVGAASVDITPDELMSASVPAPSLSLAICDCPVDPPR